MTREKINYKIIILDEDEYETLRRLLKDCKKYASFINVAKELHNKYCKQGQLYMPKERLIKEEDVDLARCGLEDYVCTTEDFKKLVLDAQDIIKDNSKSEDLIELCKIIEGIEY